YSHIVPIDNSDVDENIVVFPNPVLPGDVVNILIHSNKEKSSLVVVTDINGKEIFSKIFVINKGENVITAIEREKKLAPGLYSITYTSDERIQNRKLLIK
ncbi:MAG TPA: T9SS type A sorting domain-containing protein, partial [Bacteroidia bacterium]|nr:T9SS type A sorting domain-containing protein [Bacteroidia bacterium]